MKANIHPKYQDAEIRCACGNVIKTRSTKPVIIVGICNACHPFYTGQQKFVDTAGRVDKFQQRMAKTQAAQAAIAIRNFAQAYEDGFFPLIHCGTSYGHYKEVREQLGGRPLVMFAQGCGANINGEPLRAGFEAAHRAGKALGQAAAKRLVQQGRRVRR